MIDYDKMVVTSIAPDLVDVFVYEEQELVATLTCRVSKERFLVTSYSENISGDQAMFIARIAKNKPIYG